MTLHELYSKYPWHAPVLLLLLCVVYAPIYPRMVNDWLSDPNYSHGLLVPVVAGWFVWAALPRLKEAPVRATSLGFLLLLFGLFMLAAGLSVNELFTTRASLIAILGGIVLTLYGKAALRLLALPLLYLVLMIPLPYTVYDFFALPLKTLVSILATKGIALCGLPVLREGNMILFPNISLEVVDACSGMRSLVSLIALGTAYAFIFLKGSWRRTLLILATIPIAVLTNALRVFITGVLARHVGAAAAEGFFHEFAGLAVFVSALLLTLLTGHVLNAFPRPDKARKGEPCATDTHGDGHAN